MLKTNLYNYLFAKNKPLQLIISMMYSFHGKQLSFYSRYVDWTHITSPDDSRQLDIWTICCSKTVFAICDSSHIIPINKVKFNFYSISSPNSAWTYHDMNNLNIKEDKCFYQFVLDLYLNRFVTLYLLIKC